MQARLNRRENRCLAPFTSFSEFNRDHGGDVWFALGEDRPLACFAGRWTPWSCVRKIKTGWEELEGFRLPDHRTQC